MGDHVSDPYSGMHPNPYSGEPAVGRVRWARARPHRAVAGAWVGVVVHLALLTALMAVADRGEFWPVAVAAVVAGVIGFVWLCACWRVDPSETRWASLAPPTDGEPAVGVLPGFRAGWRPALAWVLGAGAAMTLLGGFAGAVYFGLLALLLLPMTTLLAWLWWYLVVVASQHLAAGVRGLRTPEEPLAPAPVTHDPARAAYDMAVRHASTPEPSMGVPLIGFGVMALLVLPVSACVHFSGAATSRSSVIPALLGYGGVDPTRPTLLWVGRGGFAVIVLVGVLLWWWLARERRRIEHRRRGFGEL
jgi:hypothetical protein